MLALQIAAGIVLAVLVLRFWKQSIALALGIAVVGCLVLLALWASQGKSAGAIVMGLVWGAIGIRWTVGRVQARSVKVVEKDI